MISKAKALLSAKRLAGNMSCCRGLMGRANGDFNDTPAFQAIQEELGRSQRPACYSLSRPPRSARIITGIQKRQIFQRLSRSDPSIPASRIRRDIPVVIADQAAADSPDSIKTETNSMRIGIATDHGGFELKEKLLAKLCKAGHTIVDFGAHRMTPEDDYPDFVIPLGMAVASGKVERGVAVCGSGVGAAICANKIKGVRASLVEDNFSARHAVEDDDLNLMCVGGRIEGAELAWDLIQTFLKAKFSNAPRHVRRLRKIAELENP